MANNIYFMLGDATAKGGIEKVTFTLASELSKVESVGIFSLVKSRKTEFFNVGNCNVDYIQCENKTTIYNRPYKGISGLLFDVYFIIINALKIMKKIRNTSVSHLVSCDIKMTLICVLATIFTNTKIIAIEHFEYDVPAFILKILRKYLYKYIYSVVILTSEDIHKYETIIANQKINVIPNIVNVKSFRKLKKQNKVVAVGRLTYQKGFDLLISAWAQVYKINPDWKLEIYGEGELLKDLNDLIDKYNLNCSVSIMPYAENIGDVYSSAKIFVLSSRYEGLGMVLLEALLCGIPCVSFNCPAGPKTIIKDQVNGLLVEAGNIEQLAISISKLIKDQSLYEVIKNNTASSVRAYQADVVTKKWLHLLSGGKNEN